MIVTERCASHHFWHSVVKHGQPLLKKYLQLVLGRQKHTMLAKLKLLAAGENCHQKRKTGNNTGVFVLGLEQTDEVDVSDC